MSKIAYRAPLAFTCAFDEAVPGRAAVPRASEMFCDAVRPIQSLVLAVLRHQDDPVPDGAARRP